MQHTSMSPDCKIVTVVGDHLDGLLIDAQNGKVSKLLLHEIRASVQGGKISGRKYSSSVYPSIVRERAGLRIKYGLPEHDSLVVLTVPRAHFFRILPVKGEM